MSILGHKTYLIQSFLSYRRHSALKKYYEVYKKEIKMTQSEAIIGTRFGYDTYVENI